MTSLAIRTYINAPMMNMPTRRPRMTARLLSMDAQSIVGNFRDGRNRFILRDWREENRLKREESD